MLIRRGGVTDVPWFWARLEIKCLISIQHFTRCNHDSAISQLRVLASHKTNFESVAQSAWELDSLPFGMCHLLMTLSCLDISSKKKCL